MNDKFDQFLDVEYGPIVVCGCHFRASDVLRALDVIAYLEAQTDYEDDMNISYKETL